MLVHVSRRWRAALPLVTSGVLLCVAFSASAQEPPPPKPCPCPEDKPFSFIKKAFIHKLLKKPYCEAPPDTPKGLAHKIKCEELDAPNRIAAVQYLGTVDCVAYPEARDMLIQTLQEDPLESVRLAAARALKVMLSRGAPPEEGKKKLFKIKFRMPQFSKTKTREDRRYDYCPGCCNADVQNALSAIINDTDDTGCLVEPSPRVRKAAQAALDACQVCCQCGLPAMEPSVEPPPEPMEKPMEKSQEKPDTEEGDKSASIESDELPTLQVSLTESDNERPQRLLLERPAPQPEYPVIGSLKGYCVVQLKQQKFVKGDQEFASVYRGRTYHLSTAAAKAEFDRYPETYAPAYSAVDPVHFATTQSAREGVFLREYKGRFYMFLTKENWEYFKAHAGSLAVAQK